MADSFIRVAPDSTGKRMQTFENTVSGQDVHAEGVALVDSSGNYLGGTLTPAITIASTDGNVAAGKKSVSLIPSSDYTGTILGQAWDAGYILDWKADVGYVLAQIDYTVATGNLKILTLTP